MSDYKQRLLAKHFGLESYDAAPVVPPEEVVENTDIDSEFTSTGAQVEMNESYIEVQEELDVVEKTDVAIAALESIYSSVESLYRANGGISPQTADLVRNSVGYATGLESAGSFLVPSTESFSDDAEGSTVASLEGISDAIKLLSTKLANRIIKLTESIGDFVSNSVKTFNKLVARIKERQAYISRLGDDPQNIAVKVDKESNRGAAAGWAISLPLALMSIVGFSVVNPVAGVAIGLGSALTGIGVGQRVGRKSRGEGATYLYRGQGKYPKTGKEFISMMQETNKVLLANTFNTGVYSSIISKIAKLSELAEDKSYSAIIDLLDKELTKKISTRVDNIKYRSDWLLGGMAVTVKKTPDDVTEGNFNAKIKGIVPHLDHGVDNSWKFGVDAVQFPVLTKSEMNTMCGLAIDQLLTVAELAQKTYNNKTMSKLVSKELNNMVKSADDKKSARIVARGISNYAAAVMTTDRDAMMYTQASYRSLISYMNSWFYYYSSEFATSNEV